MKVIRRRRGLMILTGLIAALVLVMAGCGSAGAGGGGGGSDPGPTATYTVTYDANGADGGGPAPTDINTYEAGATVTVLGDGGLTKTDEQFVGWNTAGDGMGTNYSVGNTFPMPAGDVTLYARWVADTVDTYTVTFNSNGGSAVAAQTVVDGEFANEPDPDPTRTGYTFDGWEDGGFPYVFLTTAVTENTILEAVWTANEYNLTFNSNDSTGTTSATGMPATIPVTFGDTANISGLTPARVGYTFAHWSETADGAAVSTPAAFEMDQEGIELFAIWTPIDYTIDFDGNTSDGGFDPGDQTVAFDAGVTLSSNTFTKTDNDFLGWSLEAGGAVAYDDEATFTMTEALIPGTGTTITLYAQWGVLPVTITFDANTADIYGNLNAGLVSGSMSAQVIEGDDTNVPLTANSFVWPGWNFLGWWDTDDFDPATDDFNDIVDDGLLVDFADFDGFTDITLYAVWEPVTLELTINNVYLEDFSGGTLALHTFSPGDEVVAYNDFEEDNPKELVRGDISSGSATLEIQIGELDPDTGDIASIADVGEINLSTVDFFVENDSTEVGVLGYGNYDFVAETFEFRAIVFADRATTLNGTLTDEDDPDDYTLDGVFDADGTDIGSNIDDGLIEDYLVPYLVDKQGFTGDEEDYQAVYEAAQDAGIVNITEKVTDLTVFNSVGFVAGWNFLYFSGSFYDDVVYSLGSGKLTIDVEATIEVQSSEPTGLNWIYEEE